MSSSSCVKLLILNAFILTSAQTPGPTSSPFTDSPTTSPTPKPTTSPTQTPTVEAIHCNIYDGRNLSNIIQTEQNTKLGDFTLVDPLIISFDFILDQSEVEDKCWGDGTICNLFHLGVDHTYDDGLVWDPLRNSNGAYVAIADSPDYAFPKVSTISDLENDTYTLSWLVQISSQYFDINLTNDDVEVVTNEKLSFQITFSGDEREIYIGKELFDYSDDNVTAEIWKYFEDTSYAFYASNPEDIALKANITNLCISTSSSSPTPAPTGAPVPAPTGVPTATPTPETSTDSPTAAPTDYDQILCYTESGNAGDLTVQCSEPGYIITSCGAYGNITNETIIFNKGAYIERQIVNDLTTDGICHISYNTQDKALSEQIIPQARCCDFEQQFNDDFKCRFFESDMALAKKFNFETDDVAKTENEYSYVSCIDEFPYMLSCTAQVIDTHGVEDPNYARTNNDIQFYGTFQVPSTAPTDEFNDENLYFSLNTGEEKAVPLAPTEAIPTSFGATPSPTATLNPTVSSGRLNRTLYSNTRCVAQYGAQTGNYTLRAVATCCTDKYSVPNVSALQEPSNNPSVSPTFITRLFTDSYGPNGVFTDTLPHTTFFENEDLSETVISGIKSWSIIQIVDEKTFIVPDCGDDCAHSDNFFLAYQGLFISEYYTREIYNNDTRKTETSTCETCSVIEGLFFEVRQCASFELDVYNGVRDYITGFDLYSTKIVVIGITFYTAFGVKYSCPDNGVFIDDTLSNYYFRSDGELENDDSDAGTLNDIDSSLYNVTKNETRNLFENNSTYGTYMLGGWRGTYETREIKQGALRSLYSSIAFSFFLDETVNTLSPTPAPTDSPTKEETKEPTLVPSVRGQDTYEQLKCQAYFNNGEVECKDGTQTMTGCNAYSTEGQIFNSYISDDNVCIASTVNSAKSVAAIATCCKFYIAPVRGFEVFKYTTIVAGILFIVFWVIGSSVLFAKIKNIKHYDEEDIDNDEILDKAIEETGQGVIDSKIAKFEFDKKEIAGMLEMQRENSYSPGLEV